MTRSSQRSMAASSSLTAGALAALSQLSQSRHQLSPSKKESLGRIMFTRDGVQYEFLHLGVPTQEVKPNERCNSRFGFYTSRSRAFELQLSKRRHAD